MGTTVIGISGSNRERGRQKLVPRIADSKPFRLHLSCSGCCCCCCILPLCQCQWGLFASTFTRVSGSNMSQLLTTSSSVGDLCLACRHQSCQGGFGVAILGICSWFSIRSRSLRMSCYFLWSVTRDFPIGQIANFLFDNWLYPFQPLISMYSWLLMTVSYGELKFIRDISWHASGFSYN